MTSSLLSRSQGKVVSVPSRTEVCLGWGGFMPGAALPTGPPSTLGPGRSGLAKLDFSRPGSENILVNDVLGV